MADLALYPHPDFPSVAVDAITVDAGRRRRGHLALRFHVEGDLEGVLWPQPGGSADRVDDLWRHSCFEAFVGLGDEPGYCEFNFASSMQWAAYRFDGYRAGMRDIHVETHGRWQPRLGRAERHFTVPDFAAPCEWRLGLSAVIEAKDGSKSYWALKHPPGKPDFHNPDCFIARLPAPVRA